MDKVTQISENRQRFDNIQMLRGIAAIIVLLLHGTYGIIPGNFGVDIFFCVSGFIMVYVTQNDAKNFLLKRIIRIVPLYWYATIQRFVLLWVCYYAGISNPDRRDVSCLISSLLFLPINGAPMQSLGWSLYYEMAFYVLFAIACFISIKKRVIITLWEIVLVLSVALFLGHDYSMFLEIAGGMGAFYLVKKLYQLPPTQNSRILCGVITIVLFALLLVIEKFVLLHSLPRVILYGIPTFLFVVFFIKATQEVKIPAPFIFCGDISFSIYLMQLDSLAVLKGIIIFLGIVPSLEVYIQNSFIVEKVVTTIIGIVLTFGVSLITYNLIEKKFTKFLRKRLLKK